MPFSAIRFSASNTVSSGPIVWTVCSGFVLRIWATDFIACSSMRMILALTKRLLEVGDQVVDVLDTDGQPHEPIVDAEFGAHIGGERRVGHQRRMLGQALDAAEAFGTDEDAQALEEAAHVVRLAGDDERHHAAER